MHLAEKCEKCDSEFWNYTVCLESVLNLDLIGSQNSINYEPRKELCLESTKRHGNMISRLIMHGNLL
jgi:hypothetical protein